MDYSLKSYDTHSLSIVHGWFGRIEMRQLLKERLQVQKSSKKKKKLCCLRNRGLWAFSDITKMNLDDIEYPQVQRWYEGNRQWNGSRSILMDTLSKISVIVFEVRDKGCSLLKHSDIWHHCHLKLKACNVVYWFSVDLHDVKLVLKGDCNEVIIAICSIVLSDDINIIKEIKQVLSEFSVIEIHYTGKEESKYAHWIVSEK